MKKEAPTVTFRPSTITDPASPLTCLRMEEFERHESSLRNHFSEGSTEWDVLPQGRLLVVSCHNSLAESRGKQALIATSEVEFTGLYGLGVQFIDGGLYVKHVSGNYRFART